MSFVNWVTGIVKLKGATDNTKIGNVGDRLKVDVLGAGNGSGIPSWSPIIYDDMNPANGGIGQGTAVSGLAFTSVYKYSGSGLLAGFVLTLESIKDDWQVRLIIDGTDVFFDANGFNTKALEKNDRYGFNNDKEESFNMPIGIQMYDNTLRFEGALSSAIKFATKIEIQIKYKTTSSTKKFRAGMVAVSR